MAGKYFSESTSLPKHKYQDLTFQGKYQVAKKNS